MSKSPGKPNTDDGDAFFMTTVQNPRLSAGQSCVSRLAIRDLDVRIA
jgi:hypothetical protein